MAEQDKFSSRTGEFLTWFRAQPGTTFHPSIEIHDLRSKGAGRGIVAIADIPADTELFTIPRQSIICKETSALVAKIPDVFDPPEPQDDDGDHDMNGAPESNEHDQSQDSWTTLILILIYEHLQGAASQWKSYLDVLPASPADFSTPMFWSADELAELQASPVASKVGRGEAEKMIRSKIVPVIHAHEDIFYSASSTQPKLSDDEIVQLAFRMGSVIMAYAFDLEKDDDDDDDKQQQQQQQQQQQAQAQEQQAQADDDEWVEDREGKTMLGMVPMADILNADAAFNAHIEHGEQALIATSLRPIAKGEEILNYYGPLSNAELLRRYGYVTRTHRRWNLIDLTWDSVLAALKAEVTALSELEWDKLLGTFVDEDGDDELEEGFILDRGPEDPDSEGRVRESDERKKVELPEELMTQMKEVMKLAQKLRPDAVPDKISRDRAIYNAIARAIEGRMNEYDTVLSQDLDIYDKVKTSALQGGFDRKTMALDVRIGEKTLLKEAGEAVQARLAKLAEAVRDGDGRSAKRRRV